jgi:hypothetical protein
VFYIYNAKIRNGVNQDKHQTESEATVDANDGLHKAESQSL